MFASCNPTRRLADDEFLLGKVVINTDTKKVEKSDLKPYLKQRPNKEIFGARFHLGVYNLAKPHKANWWNNWLRGIGEEPVLYSEILKDRSTRELTMYLKNTGYFDAEVESQVKYKKKKAIVKYNVKAKVPYRISKVNYRILDSTLNEIIYADTLNSLVKQDDIFNLQVMDEERIRLESVLREAGYFSFNRNYIFFEADSNLAGNNIDLDFIIEKNISDPDNPLPHKKFAINKVFVHTDYKRRLIYEAPESYYNELDTIERSKDLFLLYLNKINIRPNNVLQSNYIIPGNQFKQSNVDKTYRVFNSLPIVRLTNIEFQNVFNKDSLGMELVDCNVNLSLNTRHSYTIDSELSLSGGDYGGGGSFSYKNRNLFKGAETFNVKLFGEIESVKERSIDSLSEQNYIKDYGVEASLVIPKFVLPFNTTGYEKRFNPTTTFTLGINKKDLGYIKSDVTNFSLVYSWRGNKYLRHLLKPIDLYYVYAKLSDNGEQVIQLYPDKSRFNSHAIAATAYSFIYSNQKNDGYTDFMYYRHNFETAGNIMSFFNRQNDTLGAGKLFGERFAQYVKSDFDFRYYLVLNPVNTIVYRVNVGAAVPYGNSNAMPDEKLFSVGGQSSIRGWRQYQIYPDTVAQKVYPAFYKGDIKMEANIEYRFDLVWLIEGAVFADAGNVWRLSTFSTEDAEFNFRFNRFYKQLAVAGGLGLRLDLNYFVIRFDVGMKLIDPLLNPGEKYAPKYKLNLPTEERDKYNLFNFNFGIGYPF